ncbi:MAG: hypothetical protein IJ799_01760, partial [Bacteroidales bacterium]|nr:hypothetical protein [Bacteroidales bacterium]
VKFGELAGGKFPMKWGASGEVLRVYERTNNSAWSAKTTTSGYTPSGDYSTAAFEVTLPSTSASSFDYWLVYPGNANNYQIGSGDSANYLNIVRMGTNVTPQVPTATSPDNRYFFLVASKTGLTARPTGIDADFVSVSSFGKMTVTGLAAASVSNIRITFNDKSYVTGFIDYRVDTDAVSLVKSNSWSKNYIDINPKNISINSTSFDVWFGLACQTIAAGETVTVEFSTPGAVYSKTFTIPAGKSLDFQRGRVVGFNLDMAGVAGKKVLTFDFTSANAEKVPVEAKTLTAITTLGLNNFTWTADDGNDYAFTNNGSFYHREEQAFAQIAPTNYGYLGLPAIAGFKLAKIGFVRMYSGARSIEITTAAPLTDASQSLTTSDWTSATPPEIVLANPAVNTRYYIHATSGYTDIVKIILTYEE